MHLVNVSTVQIDSVGNQAQEGADMMKFYASRALGRVNQPSGLQLHTEELVPDHDLLPIFDNLPPPLSPLYLLEDKYEPLVDSEDGNSLLPTKADDAARLSDSDGKPDFANTREAVAGAWGCDKRATVSVADDHFRMDAQTGSPLPPKGPAIKAKMPANHDELHKDKLGTNSRSKNKRKTRRDMSNKDTMGGRKRHRVSTPNVRAS